MKVYLIVVFILSFAFISDASNVIYVDANGPSNPGTGTFDNPFRKIQDAINAGNDGDIVEIRPGVYTGQGNYNLDPEGKSLTIRSINPQDASVVAGTIIDSNEAGRAFTIYSQEDPNCVISGLTIRNGYAAGDSGGGIYCFGSSPTISRCVIANNAADLYGGGIYCYFSSPEISYCTISGNQAANDGGGLESEVGDVEIINCIITNNKASGLGGGVDCYSSDNVGLVNCTLVGNSAYSGGGLSCAVSEVNVKNCILWENNATVGAEIALIEDFLGASTVTVNYSDVQGGLPAVSYPPGEPPLWDTGNTGACPIFVHDPNAGGIGDLHLSSNSPCIDAGDPKFIPGPDANTDIDGKPRIVGCRVDIGAYEFVYSGDINYDGKVDFIDFAILANYWLDTNCGTCGGADLNGDGNVNVNDLAEFTKNWLKSLCQD